MATLEDVAKLAQVSSMTVSRVINNTGHVSPATHQCVMEAIAQLGYRPNMIARGLATSKTNSIGVIIPNLENPIYSVIVSGIYQQAAKYGLDIILGGSTTYEQLMHSADLLLSKQVDGLIILPTPQDIKIPVEEDNVDFYENMKRLSDDMAGRLPMVVIGHYPVSDIAVKVCVDYYGGAKRAVRYLYEQGHRRIGMVAHKVVNMGLWGERYRGFMDAMRELNCPIDSADILYCSESVQSAFEVALPLQKGSSMPTAFYCANDTIAIGVLNALVHNGFSVPQDVSVIGHDNSMFCELTNPALTTVSIESLQVGKTCVDAIVKKMNKPDREDGSGCYIVDPKLIIRESVRAI